MGVAAIVTAAAVALTSCSGQPAAAPPAASPPPAQLGQQFDTTLPAGLLDLPLTDATGQTVLLSSFLGKVVVISDVMTLCQESCPLDTSTLVEAARSAAKAGLADKVQFVSISVDPERDTPQMLTAYRKLFAPAPPNWAILTGSSSTIDTLWKTLGVFREKVPNSSPDATNWLTGQPLTYDVAHSDLMIFLDPRGHERFLLQGVPKVSPSAVPSALAGFLDAQGRQNLAHPDGTAWTAPQMLQVIKWLAATDSAAAVK